MSPNLCQSCLSMAFPNTRPRRLRLHPGIRRMVRETRLSVDSLILPLFVTHGRQIRRPIPSMPGVFQLSIDELVKEARAVSKLGILAVLLFGIPKKKDTHASEAYAKTGIVQQAVRALKNALPDLVVITDVCLCEYMSHGHCGVVMGQSVDNDASLELIAKTALSHAAAGADIVAPSDMMDGRVKAIRTVLDQDFLHVPIMSYAVKYASAFYGPFREAAGSTPSFGDRKSYQMDPANSREALREVRLDLEEGADFVMVKPAGPYLDVIAKVRAATQLPVVAYQVSGEYSMLKAAAAHGWLDEKAIFLESLIGMKRAGADLIVTYAARELAQDINA